MRRTCVVYDFEITVSPWLAWYQSYYVSRDERSGIWTVYERRDVGSDVEHLGIETRTSRASTLGEVVDSIVSGVIAAGIEHNGGAVGVPESDDERLTDLTDQLESTLREHGVEVDRG